VAKGAAPPDAMEKLEENFLAPEARMAIAMSTVSWRKTNSGLAHSHRESRSPICSRIHPRRSVLPCGSPPVPVLIGAEAGAAGKGHPRHDPPAPVHQVELVSIRHAGASKNEHERMIAGAEEVLRDSTCTTRVTLCTGDMGLSLAKKTYDIEVWLPRSKHVPEEISSGLAMRCLTAPRAYEARYRAQGRPPGAARA